MDTCEHKGSTSHPQHPVLKGPSGGVSRRERGGDKEKGPRPGPNGGNSAEVNPSFCSLRIKEAFERQRVFLFHGGPSKLQAMLVLLLGVGVGQECGHRQETELLAPGREICYCEGVGRRTAYHLSMKKKKRRV